MASTALFGPLGGSARVNVLMIGYSGEAKHGGTYLADSLNILSINPATNQTTNQIQAMGMPTDCAAA